MTQQRKRRLEQLEALARLRRPECPYVDPYEVAAALLQFIEADAEAVRAGRASWIPQYGPDVEPTPAMLAALDYVDRLAARLAQEAERGA